MTPAAAAPSRLANLERREFLFRCACAAGCLLIPWRNALADDTSTPGPPGQPGSPGGAGSGDSTRSSGTVSPSDSFVKEAYFWEPADGKRIRCLTCPHGCVLEPGETGFCRAKRNLDGRHYSLSYGNPCAVNVDPVEKKPLFHFQPGTKAFSLAVAGCNFRCLNCQNWEISQISPAESQNS